MNRKEIGSALEEYGYLMAVAGEQTFGQAVEVVAKAKACGRGIFVNGECGVGKTTFCNAAALILAGDNYPRVFELADPDSARGLMDSAVQAKALGGFVTLDDLGAENLVNEYSIRRDYVGEFICAYHNQWASIKWSPKLIVNANLDVNALVKRYDSRVVERLFELTVAWTMPGESKREWITIGEVR